jgi:hypothetical protein
MWIKIIPKSEPNNDGQWIHVEDEDDSIYLYSNMPFFEWSAIERAYSKWIPKDHFPVQFTADDSYIKYRRIT